MWARGGSDCGVEKGEKEGVREIPPAAGEGCGKSGDEAAEVVACPDVA